MEKEEKIGLFIFMIIMCFALTNIIANFNIKIDKYEYFKNNLIGISSECYQNDNQECLCKKNDSWILVDGFYTVY